VGREVRIRGGLGISGTCDAGVYGFMAGDVVIVRKSPPTVYLTKRYVVGEFVRSEGAVYVHLSIETTFTYLCA
jgi:hypothetical protein